MDLLQFFNEGDWYWEEDQKPTGLPRQSNLPCLNDSNANIL